MSNFDKLIDYLLDCDIRMIYYNSNTEEILMEANESHILELVKVTRQYLESDFSFRILWIMENWYHIFIYNQPDVDKGLVKEKERLDETFKYYLELIDSVK